MARGVLTLRCLVIFTVIYSLGLTLICVLFMPGYQQPCSRVDSPSHNNPQLSNVHRITPGPKGADTKDIVEECQKIAKNKGDNKEWGRHKLAIIVPFRDRLEELLEFVPHLHQFLIKQKIRHKIYVINQVDELRFNRGSLINVGYLESDSDCDYIAMHDVDLLPVNDKLNYSFPADGPFHIASPEFHPLYNYDTFIGGIFLITKDHFHLVNGMSNRYWGWGREDDEFFVRLKKSGLLEYYYGEKNGQQVLKYIVRRPQNITVKGQPNLRHIHDKRIRPRDNKRYFNQKAKTNKLDRETGSHTVKYDVIGRYDLVISDAPLTMIVVKLSCDYSKTPWCLKKEDHHLIQNMTKSLP